MGKKNRKKKANRAEVREYLLARCMEAGVLSEEMLEHPEHGLMVSLPGIRKLATHASSPEVASRLAHMLGVMELVATPTRGSA